uniref:Diphosphomevalonate decarboxylase n=1 Tax=Globodera pallida TaxID=36090 RepID=A0A183CGR4_GLOPA
MLKSWSRDTKNSGVVGSRVSGSSRSRVSESSLESRGQVSSLGVKSRVSELVLPLNDSIAITIDELRATTHISIGPNVEANSVTLNGAAIDIAGSARFRHLFEQIREYSNRKRKLKAEAASKRWHTKIESHTNFPTAAGLASSAAGFAAIAYGLGKIFRLSERDIIRMARMGSGSACRSIQGGFVHWKAGTQQQNDSDCFCEKLVPPSHWTQMRAVIVVVSTEHKKVGSSVGMRNTVRTSELMDTRVQQLVPKRVDTLALLRRAFAQCFMFNCQFPDDNAGPATEDEKGEEEEAQNDAQTEMAGPNGSSTKAATFPWTTPRAIQIQRIVLSKVGVGPRVLSFTSSAASASSSATGGSASSSSSSSNNTNSSGNSKLQQRNEGGLCATVLVTTVFLFLLPNNFYEIDQQSELTTVPESTVIQLDLYDSEEWRTVAGSIECDIGKFDDVRQAKLAHFYGRNGLYAKAKSNEFFDNILVFVSGCVKLPVENAPDGIITVRLIQRHPPVGILSAQCFEKDKILSTNLLSSNSSDGSGTNAFLIAAKFSREKQWKYPTNSFHQYGGLPLILAWNKQFFYPYQWDFWPSVLSHYADPNSNCPYQCIYTTERMAESSASVLLFHIFWSNPIGFWPFWRWPQHRSPEQIYTFFTQESPYYAGSTFNKLPNDWFNQSMTYRSDSTVITNYDELEQITVDTPAEDLWSEEEIRAHVRQKSKLALQIVSKCGTPSGRDLLTAQLSELIPLELFGACSGNRKEEAYCTISVMLCFLCSKICYGRLYPKIRVGFGILTTALLIAILVIQILAQYGAKKAAFGTEEIRSSIFANIDPGRIAANLEAFTEKPHPAGTEANKKVADRIMETWKANGLEDVHQIPYEVLLSYPKWDTPNHVYVLASNDHVLFKTDGLSPDLTGNDNSPEASIQWLAYSPEGTVQGQPVYCHHGRVEDFDRLEKQFGIANLNGKIAIMRYGENYRGDMVRHAYDRGASGVIIYSDPAEIARDGPEQVYPRTDWMPPSGVQRGSLLRGDGDPLTPLLPARKDFHTERTIENAQFDPETMPQIPAIPLSYGDAYQILSRMDGPEVPSEWRGGLNITYRVGPGFKSGQGQTVRVEVHSKLEVRTIQNVVGYIWGSERPDEWVMLGNHYDAWVFGAIDPNSGSAILAEVGTGLAQTVRTTGWRPKRTIVFCAWDAEEPGLIGSTEFVEEFADVLKERAIVYMNVDNIPSNVSLYVRAVPSLYQAAVDASKSVKDPITGKGSVFDSWIGHFPSKTDWLPGIPNMGIPGGGSDQKSFLDFLGIPAMMIAYIDPSRGQYPLYHTRYELPFVNEHIFDNNHLAVHKAVGEYWAELARLFADSPLLPISATTFAHRFLADYLEGIKKPIMSLNSQFPNDTEPQTTTMSIVYKRIGQLREAKNGEERVKGANELALELAVVQQAVRCAINTLAKGI